MTSNNDPLQELNQGCCGCRAYVLVTRPSGCLIKLLWPWNIQHGDYTHFFSLCAAFVLHRPSSHFKHSTYILLNSLHCTIPPTLLLEQMQVSHLRARLPVHTNTQKHLLIHADTFPCSLPVSVSHVGRCISSRGLWLLSWCETSL